MNDKSILENLISRLDESIGRNKEERDYYRGYYDALMYVRLTYNKITEDKRDDHD